MNTKILKISSFSLLIFCFTNSLSFASSGFEVPADQSKQDPAGVDLLSGRPSFVESLLSIGQGELSLNYKIGSFNSAFTNGFWDSYETALFPTDNNSAILVYFAGSSEQFDRVTNNKRKRTYGTLSGDWNTGFKYRRNDGVEIHYNLNAPNKIVYQNGFTVTRYPNYIETNNGLKIQLEYITELPLRENKVTAVNTAFDYCKSGKSKTTQIMGNCNFEYSDWPAATFDWPSKSQIGKDKIWDFSVYDANNQQTRFVITRKQLTELNRQHEYSDLVTEVYKGKENKPYKIYDYYEYLEIISYAQFFIGDQRTKGHRWLVNEAISNGVTYDYYWSSQCASYSYNTRQDCVNTGRSENVFGERRATSRSGGTSLPYLDKSSWPSGAVNYSYDYYDDLPNTISEKGFAFEFKYDSRGNAIEKRQKTNDDGVNPLGQNLSEIVEKATYAPTCNNSNFKWCNKPISVSDGNGNETLYTYHNGSGQISKIEKPADESGIRPTSFYFYVQKYAYHFHDESKTLKKGTSPIWVLVKEEHCIIKKALANNCAANDSYTIEYRHGVANKPNNLWVTSKIESAPNEPPRITCYEYNRFGNLTGETQPLGSSSSCS